MRAWPGRRGSGDDLIEKPACPSGPSEEAAKHGYFSATPPRKRWGNIGEAVGSPPVAWLQPPLGIFDFPLIKNQTSPTTAHRYERVPGGNELPFMCQRSAEIWAAEHVEIKAGEYPKIRCSRHEFGSRVG
jgi:hypothetical protein